MHPDLPVFDPAFALKHASDAKTTRPSRPLSGLPAPPGPTGNDATGQAATIFAHHDDDDEDEEEGYGPEQHPAHYVRPGRGLMSTLPPDKEDEEHLVDEDSSKGVFHHIYLVDEKAANTSVNSTAES